MEAARQEKILTVAPVAWCEDAARVLASSVLRAPCFNVEDYRQMVEHDADCKLYAVRAEGALVGYVILRIIRQSGGAEGEIVAAAGHLAGADLTRDVLPALLKMFRGVRAYRVTTARAGLVRKLLRYGWRDTHRTLRMEAPL